ncbi:MAG: hypothetical protein B7733_13970 [Myxococcales bacterium FL481]|nr:MAG: hypothetical protein B7733_13970 [Myxococcales bacterium FL481]
MPSPLARPAITRLTRPTSTPRRLDASTPRRLDASTCRRLRCRHVEPHGATGPIHPVSSRR